MVRRLSLRLNIAAIVSFVQAQFENAARHVIVRGVIFPCYISYCYKLCLFERKLNYQQNDAIFNVILIKICNVVSIIWPKMFC